MIKTPDILFITEANMWATLPDYLKYIHGYQLFVSQAMLLKHNYARIVLLDRKGIDITINENLMHEDISMIWFSLRYSARKTMNIRGVYREHQLLINPKPNPTLADSA